MTSSNCPEPFLEVVLNSEVKRFNLAPDSVCRIGRGDQNTIVLVDSQVSRSHAMVQCAEMGECYLTDLGSRNGTVVNGRRITASVILRPGDRIAVGSHQLLFQGPPRSSRVAQTQPGETAVDFSQRLITVLVADVRDFTGLSRRLPEVKLSELISSFAREAGIVLAEHGAWGQKYIGDAVMAIWLHRTGVPELQELFRIFLTLKRIHEITGGLHAQFGLANPVRIGAGVNTGLACVGNMGSDAAADYTALSEAVNLAFRLESATKVIGCDLAVGERTYRVLEGHVDAGKVFRMHKVALKGYSEPKSVFAGTESSLALLVDDLRRRLQLDNTQTLYR